MKLRRNAIVFRMLSVPAVANQSQIQKLISDRKAETADAILLIQENLP